MDQWLDWSAFGFLALLTLLDGLRQVPAGALVLRKTLGGSWRVVELAPGYRIVSWWPPLTVSVVIAEESGTAGRRNDEKVSSEQVTQRVDRMRKGVGVIMVLGAISLAALVLVVPVAIRWWGGMGFLAALMTVVVFVLLITGSSYYAGGKLGLTGRQRILFALPRLNPFASPAAGEALLERTLNSAEPVAVAQLLMKEDDFVAWIRPRAYDVVQGVETERGEALVKVIGRKQLQEIITTRPARVAAHSPWCPRCGSEFGPASTECPVCEVSLKV